MKILVYGAGVIGSIFAGKLAAAGYQITVLARGNRYNEILKDGIVLVNPKTKEKVQSPVRVIEHLSSTEAFDFIIVAMQRTQVNSILSSLAANCSKNIVFVVNTAGGYEEWAAAVGKERLIIGFPSAGGVRKNGEVHCFIGSGLQRIFQTTTFGEYSGQQTERVRQLIRLFNQAKIPSVYCENMDAWQKTHVALVTNIANALYGFNGDNYKLGRSYTAVKQMVLGIKEGRAVLKSISIEPIPNKLFWLDGPISLLTLVFSVFMKTSLAEITMARHCAVAKDEMRFLQKEFDELIFQSGLPTPEIDRLKVNLIMDANKQ